MGFDAIDREGDVPQATNTVASNATLPTRRNAARYRFFDGVMVPPMSEFEYLKSSEAKCRRVVFP